MSTIPRKKIKTTKQMENLELSKLPNKPSWLDKEPPELEEDETIERDLVDLIRGKPEGE